VDADELKKLRDQLGMTAIAHELRRMRRLLMRVKRPTKSPIDEYDDLEVMFQDDDDEEED